VATAALLAHAPEYERRAGERRLLVAALERQGVSHMYGDYWTCNLVVFATRERIVCAVLSDSLRPGLDRYRPYRAEVTAADRPAFVMPVDHILAGRVAAWLDSTGVPYDTITVGGYRIYQPAATVHPTR
jgi:hypothetical protein